MDFRSSEDRDGMGDDEFIDSKIPLVALLLAYISALAVIGVAVWVLTW